MTRDNRVGPDGSFGPWPARGGFMGNRGCLHDDAGTIRRRHQVKRWITCTLHEKPGRGAVRQRMPGIYTPLFFLDESIAAAAGHRPCAECRRAAYDDFRHAWAHAFGARVGADAMDAVLHAARIDPTTRGQAQHVAALDSLPDGCFILWQDQPCRIAPEGLFRYTPDGYAAPLPRPDGMVTVLTPAPLVAVMRAGWTPVLDQRDDRPNW